MRRSPALAAFGAVTRKFGPFPASKQRRMAHSGKVLGDGSTIMITKASYSVQNTLNRSEGSRLVIFEVS